MVFFDEIDEALDRVFLRNVKTDRFFAHVKIDLAGSAADISKIGIGHFTGTIHNTTHDGNLHSFQMIGDSPDLCCGFLQVK